MTEEVHKSAEVLRSGGLILYPTDTIWGIGCDVRDQEAVNQIYTLKKREDSKSMLILVPDLDFLARYVEEVPRLALELIEAAEKPTTIIYQGARNLALNLVAGDGSAGIRLCDDPFCKELMYQMDSALVSTSANLSGEASPAHFGEVSAVIRSGVDHVVSWRQHERKEARPSAILMIRPDGSLLTIRA